MMPWLGFMPKTPVCDAGRRTEPPASVATANDPKPALTALAAPPEEPPGVYSKFQGLRVAFAIKLSVTPLHANSELLVIPKSIAPFFVSASMQYAFFGAIKSLKSREP